MAYVEANTIKLFAEADDASPPEVWDILAASASLIFDRAAQVEENFFAPAGDSATDKFFDYQASGFYRIPPFIETLIVTINETDEVIDSANYQTKDGYLIFTQYWLDKNPLSLTPNSVNNYLKLNAKWGFTDVPADVKQAVIEQAIFLWRRRDMAFTELSGVSTAAVQQQLSSTCAMVAEKYRQIYLSVSV